MKTTEPKTNLAKITRPGALLAGLLILVGAGTGSVLAGTAAAPATTSKPVTVARPAGKGAHEGIGIHGHWIIDVRNPDGTLARHAEFENGLCTTVSGFVPLDGGDFTLTQLLLGTYVSGGWAITLGNPAIPGNPGPACAGVIDGSTTEFNLEQNNDGFVTSGGCAKWFGTNSSTEYCIAGLNPPSANSAGTAVQLSAQFTVPATVSSTQITAVGTAVNHCVGGTPATCLTSGNLPAFFQLTGAYLTGVAPMPAAITVVAGQSVSVNVQLSFH